MNKKIEDFINSCSEENQQSLRQLQWRLDQELNKYKNPVARYNRMVELFWDQVTTFQQALENPSSLMIDGPSKTNNVIPIKRPSSSDD